MIAFSTSTMQLVERQGSPGRRAPGRRGTRRHSRRRRRKRPEQATRALWLGREGSNLRMAESKSAALPLGYAPTGPERRVAAALLRTPPVYRGRPAISTGWTKFRTPYLRHFALD